jgi:hypothetical protein
LMADFVARFRSRLRMFCRSRFLALAECGMMVFLSWYSVGWFYGPAAIGRLRGE